MIYDRDIIDKKKKMNDKIIKEKKEKYEII